MDAGNTLDGRNAHSIDKHLEDEFRLIHRQIHAVDAFAGIREHLPALVALVTLAILAFPEFTTFSTAVVASHYDFSD